jgi:ubiquinone biosynthesis protein UbiJ
MAELIDPALHTAGLAALEGALNRALSLAPAGKARIAELDGRVFALECTAPPFIVYLAPSETGSVRLMGVYDGPVTTRVSGGASDFAALATSDDPTATLINSALELSGDSGPLIELQQILGQLDLDWEAPLVDALGDVTGHQLAEILRAGFSWGREAGTSLARQLEEFIHEEARLSPPRLELEDFYRDVQDLGLQVDRLASRIARLKRRVDEAGR